MRQMNFALALLTAAALTACGGGGTGSKGGDQSHPLKFTQQVSFGDSLSDVGTYAVGAVAAAGGGTFTINGDNTAINPALTGLNWTQVLAAEMNLPKPCAAQTGLNGNAPGFNVPVVNHANCYNYAQGGSRVTNPIGPGHAAVKPALGELTVPAVTQIANHLAKTGGKFSGTELITVMSGSNDVLFKLGELSSGATAAGTQAGAAAFPGLLITGLVGLTPNPATAAPAITLAVQNAAAAGGNQTAIATAAITAAAMQGANVTAAQAAAAKAGVDATAAGNKAGLDYAAATGPVLVADIAKAAVELATLIKTQILDKGAKYVIVNNMPDVAGTPSAKAQSAATQQLIATMVTTFNSQLRANLPDDARMIYVDVYAVSHDQNSNPEIYGLSNTTKAACTTESSLTCTGKTLSAPDVSHYMYADDTHPTPYENWLLARYVLKDMAVKGWL